MNHELLTISYANRRNVPNPTATPSKPPILPKLSAICDLIMQNKANFRKSQMNVTYIIIKDYENKTLGESGKNKPKTNPNKANSCPPSVWRIKG